MKTACLGKIWFSSYSQKWLLANEISVFFNRQYFTNRLISDFDFWHVDRHKWKKQGSLRVFLKTFSFVEMGHFGPKNVHPHNSGSTGRMFLKFCTMKVANRYMRMTLIIFKKKLCGANEPFWAQKGHIIITLNPL